jgi:putative ABC transport system permease protein
MFAVGNLPSQKRTADRPECARNALTAGGLERLSSWHAACTLEAEALARTSMDTLWQDLRYGIRALLKNPGFTLIAAAALALGIGANAAIFSVVDAVLLRPLPYEEPERLVWLWEKNLQRGRPRNAISPAAFAAYRDQTHVFEEVGASRDQLYNLTGAGEPESVIGYRFSAGFFGILGVPPQLGRTFRPEEDRPGHDRVVVLSHALWQRRFGGDPAVLGRAVTLDGESYTVIGVMPAGFAHPPRVELWTPLALEADQAASWQLRFIRVIARLKPGVSRAQAQAETEAVARRLAREHPETNGGWTTTVEPIESRYTGDVKPALLVLLGAVGCVLLIACANVSNLLLARATGRQREVAIRAALGASRVRVIRQLLTESVVLALLGGAAGLVLASWGVGLLLGLFPSRIANVAIPQVETIHIGGPVVLFGLALAVATAALFGMAPALQASRTDLTETLKEGGRGAAGPRSHRLRGALVVGEIALALVLSAGAMLLVRSFVRLQQGSLGFDPRNLLTLRLTMPDHRYPEEADKRAYADRLLEAIRRVPGVEAAGSVTFLPLSGWGGGREIRIEGRETPEGQQPVAAIQMSDEDYFRTARIRLVKGRVFARADSEKAPPVAVVNETLARRFWPGEDPVGKRVSLRVRLRDVQAGGEMPWREVVGVVGDVRHYGLAQEPEPEIHLPYRQVPVELVCLAVRTGPPPEALAQAVKDAVWSVDGDQPMLGVMSMEQLASDSVTLPRASMWVLAFFAGLALLLAGLGIYGVMAQTVAQRTQEIGVRIALGAGAGNVLAMVLRHGALLAALGIALGLAASVALTRVMSSLLFGVEATDPVTFALVSLLLGAVALVACYVPARRAATVDPIAALRYE